MYALGNEEGKSLNKFETKGEGEDIEYILFFGCFFLKRFKPLDRYGQENKEPKSPYMHIKNEPII